jgi:hypothetical protein
MSKNHLPRRVDFTPTSEMPKPSAPDEAVPSTGERGRLIDSDPECLEQPKTRSDKPHHKDE